ncbi:RNA methyltransferase [Aureibaculum marinum]|uniref:RNA methyltransferase n=1 Tax=Aureibaculum marinum TaxID=2487930 RepID=A0A3N4N6F6_9FLAO|nr:RNA methyltransferase [Aureibaculum marinum]RPD90758.1 RNA methyltransferase [Aureibaculum marinum]
MNFKEITSLQNSLIKKILQLQNKSRVRKNTGHFVIEGKREISLALKGNYTLTQVLYCETIYKDNNLEFFDTEIIKISREIYQKLAQRDSTEGIIAIAESKNNSLSNLKLKSKSPLLLVAEAPEKPGNIGALLRTADAANVDAVLIANPKTDVYNPNIIRSSVGCVFTKQIATGTTSEIIEFLKEQNCAIYCAALTASKPYQTIDYTKSTAIVVGTEATGLSDEWLTNSTQNIIIPMQGQIDSLNVSVSAAILIFEAKRQRNFI